MRRAIQWSGGLAFAAALAATAYVLAVMWPHVQAVPGSAVGPALLWNALLFSGFALHHSLLARDGVKSRLAAFNPALVTRTCYVWIASVLLTLVVFAWEPVGHHLWTVTGIPRICVWLAQLAGVWIVLTAGRVFDPLELAGLRPARDSRLEVRGPYRWVRHPLYLGTLLVLWAAPSMTGDRLWFAVLSTFYIAAAVPWEEATLQASLGPDYARYRTQVRWRIVPGLY